MEWSKAIKTFLGEDVPSDETLNEKFTGLLADQAALQTEKESLEQELEQLKADKEELEQLRPLAEIGTTYLADQRQEAERLYRLLKGEAASEKMLKLIREADIEQARIYVEEFGREVEEQLPGICSECGKPAKLIRRSSQELTEEKLKAEQAAAYKLGKVNQ